MDYDFKAKKMGSSENRYATSGYLYPEVENIFVNISTKTKIFWGVDLGPRYFQFMKKTDFKNLLLT